MWSGLKMLIAIFVTAVTMSIVFLFVRSEWCDGWVETVDSSIAVGNLRASVEQLYGKPCKESAIEAAGTRDCVYVVKESPIPVSLVR